MVKQEKILVEKEKQKSGSITVQNVNIKTYDVSPEIMENIRQSIMLQVKSDPTFLQEIFKEAFNEKFQISPKKQTAEEETITLKQINQDDAKVQIKNFIETYPGCKTSDIVMELQLEPSQVIEILKVLKEEEVIQSKDV